MNLVVITPKFGLSYSGGCTATAKYVEQWQDAFDNITVLCQKTDGFLNNTIKVVLTEIGDLQYVLDGIKAHGTIGYGDFHSAKSFVGAGMPYYFTYHDNWPELSADEFITDEEAKIQMESYANIFANAEMVYSVTKYKLPYVRQYTTNVTVVRNGISQRIAKMKPLAFDAKQKLRILMAGNITKRKYKYALEVFEELSNTIGDQVIIDIYGHPSDLEICSDFDKYDFVRYLGFSREVTYDRYHLYINTSTIENLSLSVVDALANCTPVVAFDIGGLHEIITPKVGMLVPPFKIKQFVKSIARIIAGDFNFDPHGVDLSDYSWAKSGSIMLDHMKTRTQSYTS